MLKLSNLNVSYGNQTVLDDFSIEFERGTITSIIGPNGAGKSTIIKSILNVIKINSGAVYLNDVDMRAIKRKDIAKKIAYLPQSRNVPNISAYRLVLHGRFPHLNYPRIFSNNDKNIALECLKMVNLTNYKNQNLMDMSGGERQKVYLAMILAQQTDIIILDEPTTYLDIDYRLFVWKIIDQMKREGKTVIVISHDIEEAMIHSDKVCVLKKGNIVSFDTPNQIYENKILEKVFDVKVEKINNNYIFKQKDGMDNGSNS